MKSYWIFALVLTILYIIYYALNIVRDLYWKRGKEKSTEEVFDLGTDDAPEESVDVVEEENGFSVGSAKYATESVPDVPSEKKENSVETPVETAEERLERLKAKMEARMEETNGYLSDPYTSQEMYKAMISGGQLDNRPKLEWKPLKDKL